jgi:hypothetical protein
MPRVDNKGISIHYRVEGNGPTVVLGHGITDSSDVWYERGYVLREGRPMPHQSAYADSIKRLTIAMREMLGMGPAADIPHIGAPPAERKSTARWTPSVPPRLPLIGRLTASVSRRDAARHKTVAGRRRLPG